MSPVYARYNDSSHKYADVNRLYGLPVSFDTQLHWAIEVDWTGGGTFSGQNEAVYAVDFLTQRGRQNFIQLDGNGVAVGFGKIQVGSARIVLDNTTGRFDPYNSSGPLYGNIVPGRYIRVRVNYNGVTYPIFAGKIKDIQPSTNSFGEKQVIITCEDGMRLLQQHNSVIPVYASITKDAAIGHILDDVAWPSIWGRNLDVSADTLPYWWANGLASDETYSVATAELGNFFVAADGKATFYSRNHAYSTAATVTSAQLLKEISIPQPWEVIRNNTTVIGHPLVAQSTGNLWTMTDKPLVKAGTSLNSGNGVTATYQYNNTAVSATGVLTPVATTDFTVNTKSDGTGVDLTSSCTVTATDNGTSALIKLTNNSGSDGYITLLKIRGNALYSADSSTVIVNDSSSQTTYGKLSFSVDNQWFQDTNFVGNVALYLNAFSASAQKFLTVQLESQPTYQFTPDLFGKVNATVAALNISATNYAVGYIEHRWITQNGQAVATTWHLEPFRDTSIYWWFNPAIGGVYMGIGTRFGL